MLDSGNKERGSFNTRMVEEVLCGEEQILISLMKINNVREWRLKTDYFTMRMRVREKKR